MNVQILVVYYSDVRKMVAHTDGGKIRLQNVRRDARGVALATHTSHLSHVFVKSREWKVSKDVIGVARRARSSLQRAIYTTVSISGETERVLVW